MNADTGTPLPLYRCHKEVWALKIATIPKREPDGSALLAFAEPGYAPLLVDAEYMRKHDPHVGGYYVVYKDGYQSFSPAQAFEEGYTRV